MSRNAFGLAPIRLWTSFIVISDLVLSRGETMWPSDMTYRVRLRASDASVPPDVVGRMVDMRC